jgi:hypothetical protein
MTGKANGEPQPLPTVGGSFLLNKKTGVWEPISVETPTGPDSIHQPETSPDGTDS